MKKGFTLIEMVAVILILALIAITTLPTILNQVSNKQEQISEANKTIIYDAAEQFLMSNSISYPKIAGNNYCITLNELVNNGKLTAPIKDLESGNEISLNTTIKASLNVYSDYEYCIVNETDVSCNSCTETRN